MASTMKIIKSRQTLFSFDVLDPNPQQDPDSTIAIIDISSSDDPIAFFEEPQRHTIFHSLSNFEHQKSFIKVRHQKTIISFSVAFLIGLSSIKFDFDRMRVTQDWDLYPFGDLFVRKRLPVYLSTGFLICVLGGHLGQDCLRRTYVFGGPAWRKRYFSKNLLIVLG